jgi:hypothetical protein
MKPTPLQARMLRLLATTSAYVDANRGRAWVEPDRRTWGKWGDPGYEPTQRAYIEAQAAAALRGLRRASVEACLRAGWLTEDQYGPNDWNRGWFITDAGREIVAVLGLEDFMDRPRSVALSSLSADVMIDGLRDRWHGLMGWVWFREFSPGVNGRRVDAMAINRWASRGYERMAFEIKRSRGDFLGELKDPAKREESGQVADRFWFVTPAGMVQLDEVPGDCGLVWVDEDGRVSIKRKAPKREKAPTNRHLVGAILTYIVDRPAQQEWRKAMKDL